MSLVEMESEHWAECKTELSVQTWLWVGVEIG